MTKDAVSERSYEIITRHDLKRLAQIARDDLADFAKRHKRAYLLDNLLCIALCQGAALHYVNRTNGVKDFDVYLFFAKGRGKDYPPRRNKHLDFGPSMFGRHPRVEGYLGRCVDVLGRSIPHRRTDAAPLCIKCIKQHGVRDCFSSGPGTETLQGHRTMSQASPAPERRVR